MPRPPALKHCQGAHHALPVITCAQARAIDKAAAARLGVPTLLLMENAARHAAHLALELRAPAGGWCACAGGATTVETASPRRLLESAGVPCEVVLPEEPDPASDACVTWPLRGDLVCVCAQRRPHRSMAWG